VSRAELLASVGERLISIRASLGLALESAARLARLAPERLAEAEAGEVALTEHELQRLAEAYDLDVTAFFGGRVTPISYLFGA
jgi:transcriptional regulator with XRE-family HTH domain